MTGHDDIVAADPEGTPNSVLRSRRQPRLIGRLRFLAECVVVFLFLITASTPFPVSVLTVESAVEIVIDPVPVEETIRCEPLQVGRTLQRGGRIADHQCPGPAEIHARIGEYLASRTLRQKVIRPAGGHRWNNGDRAPLMI